MKKQLLKLLMMSGLLALASCNNSGNNTSIPSEEPTQSNSEESSSSVDTQLNLVMNDLTVDYDGNAHSIFVEGLPSDASVTYTNNEKVEPGGYKVSANVTLKDGTTTNLSAKLTINKLKSVLSAEKVQEAINCGKGVLPAFNLNNTEQQLNISEVYKPGVHELEIYAKESKHYLQSNKVKVTLTVSMGNSFDVEFAPATYNCDGTEKSIVAKNIPDGYRVEYENNTATKQGKYNAVCKLFDSNNELKLTLNALLVIENTPNAEFDKYLDEFFVDYLGNDYISWNILTENPADFGFTREASDVAQWYTYETITAQDKKEAYDDNLVYHQMLKDFNVEDLSFDQIVSYEIIDNLFEEQLEFYNPANSYDFLMNLNYVDQFGGYAAEFATYMEAYSFRRVQDVVDVIDYIKSMPTAFASYDLYVTDRANAGYPISDFTLTSMIDYLDGVVEQGSEYYLGDYISNRIQQCDFLSAEEKESYSSQIKSGITEYFITACADLSSKLVLQKGKCTQTGYLAAYGEAGKKQYEYELKTLLGFDEFDVDKYGEYLLAKIEEYVVPLNQAVNTLNRYSVSDKNAYNTFMSYLNRGISMVGIEDPLEMIDYLKEFATTIVPTLEETPEITVKYMDDASAEVSNAVAYYMKSPLDNTGSEYITLNGKQLGSDLNDTLSTMAHEGYPGHLYAYLYNKSLNISNLAKITTSTAHAEGWATYVQFKLFEYIKANAKGSASVRKAIETYCDYLTYNQMVAYTLYAYLDYRIHWSGWDKNEISKCMDKYGFNSDLSVAQELYNTLIEIPTTYAAYGFGQCYFMDLHNEAKEALGGYYDEIEFNSVIHSRGWCSLGTLEKVVDEYIEQTVLKYTIIEA